MSNFYRHQKRSKLESGSPLDTYEEVVFTVKNTQKLNVFYSFVSSIIGQKAQDLSYINILRYQRK